MRKQIINPPQLYDGRPHGKSLRLNCKHAINKRPSFYEVIAAFVVVRRKNDDLAAKNIAGLPSVSRGTRLRLDKTRLFCSGSLQLGTAKINYHKTNCDRDSHIKIRDQIMNQIAL
jgi:hypothetical protein